MNLRGSRTVRLPGAKGLAALLAGICLTGCISDSKYDMARDDTPRAQLLNVAFPPAPLQAALSAPAVRAPARAKPAAEPEPAPAVPRKRVAVPPPEEDDEAEEALAADEAIERDDEGQEAAEGNGKLPQEIVEATKLRDILTFFIETEETKDAAELTALCEANKESIPLLGRIANIGERVERTLQVMVLD